jgi:hypothetical protein
MQWTIAHDAVFCAARQEYSSFIANAIQTERNNSMNRLAIAALSLAAFAAHAESADPRGQFAAAAAGQATRADVQAQLAGSRQAGVNPWSTSYNPLKSFQGSRTRAEVRAEYIASRDSVAAMTREDSGSAYLAARPAGSREARHLAGQPVNAQ